VRRLARAQPASCPSSLSRTWGRTRQPCSRSCSCPRRARGRQSARRAIRRGRGAGSRRRGQAQRRGPRRSVRVRRRRPVIVGRPRRGGSIPARRFRGHPRSGPGRPRRGPCPRQGPRPRIEARVWIRAESDRGRLGGVARERTSGGHFGAKVPTSRSGQQDRKTAAGQCQFEPIHRQISSFPEMDALRDRPEPTGPSCRSIVPRRRDVPPNEVSGKVDNGNRTPPRDSSLGASGSYRNPRIGQPRHARRGFAPGTSPDPKARAGPAASDPGRGSVTWPWPRRTVARSLPSSACSTRR
jgi:hypothetical protein